MNKEQIILGEWGKANSPIGLALRLWGEGRGQEAGRQSEVQGLKKLPHCQGQETCLPRGCEVG